MGQNYNYISDGITPGPELFVLQLIAVSSWCHLGRRHPGTSAAWISREKERCRIHGRAGETNLVTRLEPSRTIGQSFTKGVENFDMVLVESSIGNSLQETEQQENYRKKCIKWWNLRFEITTLVKAGLQVWVEVTRFMPRGRLWEGLNNVSEPQPLMAGLGPTANPEWSLHSQWRKLCPHLI